MPANPNNDPARVRLTEDYLDLPAGVAFAKGTVLVRSPHNREQWVPEGEGEKITYLGKPCVSGFDRIRDISEPV